MTELSLLGATVTWRDHGVWHKGIVVALHGDNYESLRVECDDYFEEVLPENLECIIFPEVES